MSKQNSEAIAAVYDALPKQDLPFLLKVIDPQVTITQTQQLPWWQRSKL